MIKTKGGMIVGCSNFWGADTTFIGSGAKKTLDQLIKSLFANNEQGFAYDPNDMSTMFQGTAGTVPVTDVGQPVGLMLDKSKGLLIGNEIISDVELNNSTYWTTTPNVAVSNGVATFTNATTAQALISPNGITSLNQWYEVEIFVDSITSGQISITETGSPISSVLSVGLNRVKILANGSAGRSLRIYALGTTNAVVSKLSAKPITGNHAYQTTSAARPILRDTPRRIGFDTVDDKLITNLPAQLTGCTVIRSVPNVGTQVLTGQTIPATHEDNTDHCGLLVINRGLTASETSTITAEFNKRAGV